LAFLIFIFTKGTAPKNIFQARFLKDFCRFIRKGAFLGCFLGIFVLG
jgi:hypothetical protein